MSLRLLDTNAVISLVARRSERILQAASAVTLQVLPSARHFYYPPQDLALLQQHFRDFITTHA